MVKITTNTGKELVLTAYTDLRDAVIELIMGCTGEPNPTITINHYAAQYPKTFNFVNTVEIEKGIQILCDALYYSGHFMRLTYFTAQEFNPIPHYVPIAETGAAIYHLRSDGKGEHACCVHIVR